MTLPQLPADKANHVVYGVAIALTAKQLALTAMMFGLDVFFDPSTIGLAAAVAFGVGKEAFDEIANVLAVGRGEPEPHGVDILDAIATASGGLAVWVACT
jgi:hypothetical protein